MEFVDGVATFQLKNGESLTATGLPTSLDYTVTVASEEGFTSEESITGTIPSIAAFNHTYSAEGSVMLEAKANVENPYLQYKIFFFNLLDADNAVIQNVGQINETGKATFPITYTLADLKGKQSKDFDYTIEQVIPEGAKTINGWPINDGVAYENEPKQVTVTVTDNGDGTLGVSDFTIPEWDNKVVATVTADDLSKVYGENDPKLTAKVKVGEEEISEEVVYSLSRVEGDDVDNYVITPEGEFIQGDYAIIYNSGTLTINPKEVTPSITVAEMTYDGNPINISDNVTIKESDADDAPVIDPSEYTLTIMQGENEINPENLKHSGEYTLFITDAKTDDADGGNYIINDANEGFSISQQTISTSYNNGENDVDNAIRLEGHETSLSDGWYVCNEDLSYDHGIELSGEVNIIITDGATLNISSSESSGLYSGTLNIYGQDKENSHLDIIVEGDDNSAIDASAVTLTNVTVTAEGANGISVSGALSISGGKVTATGSEGSGLTASGNIDISSNGNVTASGNNYGISSGEAITIGGSMVEATGTTGDGLYAVRNIEITNDGSLEGMKVTASGKNGIYSSSGDISIENCEVNATGSEEKAVYAANVTLTGATVTAEGADGIYANSGDLSISGGKVDATATGTDGSGLYASSSIAISEKSVVTSNGEKYGISAPEVILTGVTVTAEGADGIYASNGVLSISGGKVDATATGSEGSGLTASGNIDISSNGDVTASGNNYGISSGEAITIGGSMVEATGTTGEGLYAVRNIEITNDGSLEGMKVTASGKNGIYSSSGDISIENCEVNATGTTSDGINANAITLTGATVDANGNGKGISASVGALRIEGGSVTATATGSEGSGLYASGDISIFWTDKDNDFITASSYDGNVVIADGQHFRAVSGENTVSFISRTLDKSEDEELIASLAGTTLKPYDTEGYVVTVVGDNLTAGAEPTFENNDTKTKFYVYSKDASVTVDYDGEGIVEVNALPESNFEENHTFTMPEEDVTLTYSALDVDKFTLTDNSVEYDNTVKAPNIQYDNADFDNYTLLYIKGESTTPAAEVKLPGTYSVELTGQRAYIGTVDINGEFVINPNPNFSTMLFAEGSQNQWMTWCGADELVKPDDVIIYTVTRYADGKVTLSEMERSTAQFGDEEKTVIPAYTPVLLYQSTVGNEAVSAMFYSPGTGTDGVQMAEGTKCSFFGTTTQLESIPSNYYNGGLTYVLYGDKFLKSDSNNGIAANRCWLKLDAEGGTGPVNARQLVIVVDDETTAVESEKVTVNSEKFAAATVWYTLDGRKLSGKPTKKGLYIYNGKKTVVK